MPPVVSLFEAQLILSKSLLGYCLLLCQSMPVLPPIAISLCCVSPCPIAKHERTTDLLLHRQMVNDNCYISFAKTCIVTVAPIVTLEGLVPLLVYDCFLLSDQGKSTQASMCSCCFLALGQVETTTLSASVFLSGDGVVSLQQCSL